MNPFQKHGIEHLSASSLNLARDNLPLWIIRYLGKVKGQQSVNMLAGIAVEEAIARGLDHPDMDEETIIQFAKDEYLKKTALGFDQEDRESKLQEITGRPAEGRKQGWDGMVRNALRTLRPYGIPTKPENGKQHRIEVFLDGIPVPLIGFKDFSFDQHGLDIDLKTTARMPSDMSFDHQLQGAVYWKASGNRAQRFAYVTKSKADVLELTPEAATYAIHTATGIAHCLQRFLSLSSDWQELSQLTIPDYSNFRWDSLTAGAARELWGF